MLERAPWAGVADEDQSQFNYHDPQHDLSLITKITEELYHRGLASAAMASTINAIVDRKPVRLFGPLAVYFPQEPSLFNALDAGLIAVGAPCPWTGPFAVFYKEMRLAIILTNARCEGVRPVRLATTVDFRDIALEWAAVCRALIAALEAIPLEVITRLGIAEKVIALAETAAAVEAGQAPFLTSDGAIVVPGALERRVAERKNVGIDVWLESVRGRQRVVLRDISAGGAGFEKCLNLTRGMPVTLQLPAGRRLSGIVVWIQGDRAGVRFHMPLVDTDPVLSDGHFVI